MTVLMQSPGMAVPAGATKLDEIAKACHEKIQAEEDKAIKNKQKKRSCQKLGQDKHACCEEKIKEHQDSGDDPQLEGEKSYRRPTFDSQTGQANTPVNTATTGLDRNALISQAISTTVTAAGAGGATRAAISAAIGKALGGNIFPDAAVLGPGGEKTLVDFKFACPPSHRSKRRSAVAGYSPPGQSPAQSAAHTAIGQATGGGATITILH